MSDESKLVPRREDDLQNALQELVETGEQPDAEMLETIVARHPQHAAELTDFAVEWALQELLPESVAGDQGESAVPAAMERFRARIAELEHSDVGPAALLGDGSGRPAASFDDPFADPFAERTPAELKRVAGALGLDKTLVAKLRDRKIVAETVPDELFDGLAMELEVPPAAIVAHLAQPAVVYAGASFKAAGKPEVGPKESFAEAVRRSFMEPGAKTRWLSSGPLDAVPPADPDSD